VRPTVLLLATAVLLASGVLALALSISGPREAQTADIPNILFVLTDDQDPGSIARMGKLKSHLVDQGTTFTNAFATTPQCCPSRATLLRGQYAHNHGVLGNNPPLGGFAKFRDLGHERSTIATWLNDAGYTTAFVGRYLNGYGEGNPTRYIPPGWDQWWAMLGGRSGETFMINENGRSKTYDRDSLHDTDYFSRKAEGFIRNRRGAGAPWFMVVATSAPHLPSYAARRHEGMFQRAKMPKPPSFNEADVSDKPLWVQRLPRLGSREVSQAETEWRRRQRSLQSVDDLVGNVVGALAETNQLDETYVVYASDNGYLLYLHREHTKGAPYEESIGVPLVVRGPNVPRGAERSQLVSNTDWAPTMAGWAGVATPGFVDGRSFAPLLSESPPLGWRSRLLIEDFRGPLHGYRGIRTAEGETYVEYQNGDKEYYDLATDPWQLGSVHRAPENAARLNELSAALSGLKECAGASCGTAEDAPLQPASTDPYVPRWSIAGSVRRLPRGVSVMYITSW
jgi:N-acetylglucosamine-6-sulfatase